MITQTFVLVVSTQGKPVPIVQRTKASNRYHNREKLWAAKMHSWVSSVRMISKSWNRTFTPILIKLEVRLKRSLPPTKRTRGKSDLTKRMFLATHWARMRTIFMREVVSCVETRTTMTLFWRVLEGADQALAARKYKIQAVEQIQISIKPTKIDKVVSTRLLILIVNPTKWRTVRDRTRNLWRLHLLP